MIYIDGKQACFIAKRKTNQEQSIIGAQLISVSDDGPSSDDFSLVDAGNNTV